MNLFIGLGVNGFFSSLQVDAGLFFARVFLQIIKGLSNIFSDGDIDDFCLGLNDFKILRTINSVEFDLIIGGVGEGVV